MTKVFIGLPSVNRIIGIETGATLFAIARDLASNSYETEFLVLPNTWIDGARNFLCQKSIEWGSDWTVMIDDDMAVKGEAIREMIQNDVDVCAPLMHQRRFPYAACAFELRDNNYKPILHLKRKLIECEAVGTGLIVIRTSILSNMLRPWFKSGQVGENNERLGEDVYFCRNAKRHKFKVYYDGRFQAIHFGDPIPVHTDWVTQIPNCPLTIGD